VNWRLKLGALASYGVYLVPLWGRPGFDRGCKAEQGIPRPDYLVNTI
jgi:hypothetical protein